jgi:hypothetical protein
MDMFPHMNRLTRAGAVALVIAAAAAPSAVARPVDGPADWKLPAGFETADTRDAVTSRGLYEPMRPESQPQPPQDIRNPDTVDYANGRGTYNAPDVVVVKDPAPVTQPAADGMDWADAGIGAGSLLALSLIALGGSLVVVQRRGARHVAG